MKKIFPPFAALLLWVTEFNIARATDSATFDINGDRGGITQFWFRPGTATNTGAFADQAVGAVYKVIVGVVSALAVIMVMAGGFQYLTAGGSPEKIKKARSMIIGALLGVMLFLSALIIINLIYQTYTYFLGQ